MPTLGGSEKTPPEGDLIMRDAEGLVASVLLGPDSRTRMAPSTSRALFVVYSPPGIGAEELEAGLDRIEEAVALACPGARASGRRALVLGAEV
jgi:DNA/RNA-binding domain of Phe-tRNA-synthetase-like protein